MRWPCRRRASLRPRQGGVPGGSGAVGLHLGSALLLVMHGISSMLNQVPVVRLEAGIWVSVGSIVLTLLLVSFQGFVIRKTNSVAIKADMLHYRSDLLLNGGVLVALVLAGQGGTGPTACLPF